MTANLTVTDLPEEWRPIPRFEGRYEVSSLGRIRTLGERGPIPTDRILTPSIDRYGYEHVTIFAGSKKKLAVHFLVALAFLGPRPGGMEVRHLDGNHRNNAATNLAYGSKSQNRLDSVRHGTHNNARKTHCPAGHEYTPENTKTHLGKRNCRICTNAQARAKYRESRGKGVSA